MSWRWSVPELAEAVAECVHHWVLGETDPEDGSVAGECRYCGAQRVFQQRGVMETGWRSTFGLGWRDPYEISRDEWASS